MCVLPSVRPSVCPQKAFFDFHLIWCGGRPPPLMCTSVIRPDLRSRSRSRSRTFRSCKNCTFLGLSPPPFWHRAQNWWLVETVWDLDYSLSELDFLISSYESYQDSSNFTDCRYFTKFKWPYFSNAWCYSHVLGHASSPTHPVYVIVTLTRSKVKVTDHLNFRQLPITAHF